MPKVKYECPRCGYNIVILEYLEDKEIRKVVCPHCFLPFTVRTVYGVDSKSGLPAGDKFEVDPRQII